MGEGGNGKRFKSTSTGREHFAAVAAALGIPSDLVMAAHDVKGKPYAIVLYTPGFPDDDRIWSAHIERGPTGTVTVLEKTATDLTWREMVAETERMRADLARRMGFE